MVRRRSLLPPVLLFIIGLNLSCKEDPAGPTVSASIEIFPRIAQVYVGQQTVFSFDLTVAGTSSELPVRWEIGNDAVASIDQNGVCTAKGSGATLVVVTVTNHGGAALDRDTATVLVGQYDLALFPRQLRLASGQSNQLYPTAALFPIQWSSTDESVATVTQTGLVEATGMGRTSVIAEVRDGSNIVLDRDTCTVVVEWEPLLSVTADITAFSASPDIASMLVGVKGGIGVMASSDGGATWNQANAGLSVSSSSIVREIARFRPSPNIVMTSVNGVAVSTDGGFSWSPTAITGDSIVSIVMHPTESMTAYVTKENNTLYKTTDRGASWNSIPSPPAISGLSPRLFIDPILPSVLYVGGHGSFVSTNSGSTWNQVMWPGQGPENAVMHVDNAGQAYLQDYNWDGTLQLRMMRSLDHGQSWSQVKAYPTNGYPFVYTSHRQTVSCLCIASSATLTVSTNGGQSWVEISAQPFAAGAAVGAEIVSTAPLEIVCAIGRDVWRYRQAP